MCFAGKDAPVDPRTGKSKCLKDVSYVSAINLFTENWKDCFLNPLCNLNPQYTAKLGPKGLGGPEELQKIQSGSQEDENKAFE